MKLLALFVAMHFALAASKRTIIPVFRVEKLENCQDKPLGYYNDKTELVNITVSQMSRNIQMVNCMALARNIVARPKVRFNLSRCQSRLMGTCEHFMAVTFDVCDLVVSKNFPLFTEAIKNIHPKLSCPFQDGKYECRNLTVDANYVVDYFKAVPDIDKYFWVSRSLILGRNSKENACIDARIKLDYIRNHRN